MNPKSWLIPGPPCFAQQFYHVTWQWTLEYFKGKCASKAVVCEMVRILNNSPCLSTCVRQKVRSFKKFSVHRHVASRENKFTMGYRGTSSIIAKNILCNRHKWKTIWKRCWDHTKTTFHSNQKQSKAQVLMKKTTTLMYNSKQMWLGVISMEIHGIYYQGYDQYTRYSENFPARLVLNSKSYILGTKNFPTK